MLVHPSCLDQQNGMSLSHNGSLVLVRVCLDWCLAMKASFEWAKVRTKGREATVDEAITKFPRGRPTDRNGIAVGVSAFAAISDGGSWVKSGGLIFFPVVSPILVDDGTVRNVRGEKLTGGGSTQTSGSGGEMSFLSGLQIARVCLLLPSAQIFLYNFSTYCQDTYFISLILEIYSMAHTGHRPSCGCD